MKLIDKIMDTLKLYDEDDDILDEELEVKKPSTQEKAATAKPEKTSLFRRNNLATSIPPAPKGTPVDLPEPVMPAIKEKKPLKMRLQSASGRRRMNWNIGETWNNSSPILVTILKNLQRL